MTQQSPDYEPHETDAAAPQTGPGPGPAQAGPSRAMQAPGVPAQPAAPARTAPTPEDRHVTRAGMVWVAVATALAVMVLLIIFILQNQDYVQVRYFGLEGAVPLGIALFIAAVGGGVLVAVAGAARIIQLRAAAHRRRVTAERVR